MSNSRTSAFTRRTRIAAIAACVVVTLGVAVSPASAETAHRHHAHGLVGAWQLTGTDDGNPVNPKIVFHPNHTLDFTPPDNSFDGTGHWQEKRDGSFTFDQGHPINDAAGRPESYIHADITGQQTGDTLTAGGHAELYDLDGNQLAAYVILFDGVRLPR
jgi:hypothetical protein